MFVVDTNVLVYATNEELDEHAHCRQLLERWQKQPSAWFTTWGVLYEFLRVVSHPRVHRRPWRIDRAVGFVQDLLASPGLTILSPTSRHASILAKIVEEVPGLEGSILHDVHTAVLMREHGIRQIVTRDKGFRRFPFLEVVDPLKPSWPEGVRDRPSKRLSQRGRSRARA